MLQLVREGHGWDQWAEARLIDKVLRINEEGTEVEHGEVMRMVMARLGIIYAFSWGKEGSASFSGVRHTGLTRWTRMERGREAMHK